MNDVLFEVKSDRFSLVDQNEYFVRGWIADGVTLEAEADGAALESRTDELFTFSDERHGGLEVCLVIRVPETVRRSLVVKAMPGGRTVFRVLAADLAEKRQIPQVYLDDVKLDPERNIAIIAGWTAAKEDVEIRTPKLPEGYRVQIERTMRPDVNTQYEECEVTDEAGFLIRLTPIPKGGIVLRFAACGQIIDKKVPTGKAGLALQKGQELFKKTVRYIRRSGLQGLRKKIDGRKINKAIQQVYYPDWIAAHLPTEETLAAQRKEAESLSVNFLICPVSVGAPEALRNRMKASLAAQSYDHWHFIESSCLASVKDEPDPAAKESAKESDKDFAESAKEFAESVKELVLFVPEDAVLAPNALYEIEKAAGEDPALKLIYTDEDAVDAEGSFSDPNMKPGFSPDYLRAANYIGSFWAAERTILEKVFGEAAADRGEESDKSAEGSFSETAVYDLLLRITEKTDRIFRIPRVLCHENRERLPMMRRDDTAAMEAEMEAIRTQYERLGLPAAVEAGDVPFTYRTKWHWDEKPMVSVIIPNKDHLDDLRLAIESLLRTTTYENFEILVIENNSTEPETFAGYEELAKLDSRIRVIYYEGGFNFSAINNLGVKEAKGEYLLLLNNDTEALSDVIPEMLGFCLRPDVAMVGARLYYGDNTVQHAGVVLGWGGVAGHAFVGQKRGAEKIHPRMVCQQDMSAVTAACVMIRRSVFEEVGGLNEDLAVAFNDIDFCMKVREAGYLIVYDPYAELYHYESKSRGLEDSPEKVARFQKETAIFRKRWGHILEAGDPYYNPNLSMVTQDFTITVG